jgi:ADP-ribose pyrophosphatase YjhB (NUDIX family)
MIQTKAMCLLQNKGRVLCIKYFDAVKKTPFYRVLGGGVEVGELASVALAREFQEELGANIQNVELLDVLENIFVHEGALGHEIVFLYKADFEDGQFYAKDVLPVNENGVSMEAHWLPVSSFLGENAPPLYPKGVWDFIESIE